MRIAEQLGATTVTLIGQRMSDEILAFARTRNVSKIVVGKPSRRLWERIVFGSIVDALVEGSGEADVYVISGKSESPPVAVPRPRRPVSTDWLALWAGGGGGRRGHRSGLGHVPVLPAVEHHHGLFAGRHLVATRHGRGPSFLASLLSVVAFDFFFVPPYLTFAVSDVEYLITFVVMLLAGLVISGLTARIRAQAEAARHGEQQTAALYAMCREFASTRGLDALLDIAVRHISEVFRSQVVLLLPDAEGPGAPGRGAVRRGRQRDRRRPLGVRASPCRRTRDDDASGSPALYVPLVAPRGPVGVLGVRPLSAHEFDAPERLHELETFASQTALAIERARLAEEAQEAQVQAESERLRNSLLTSVSHDLRTPLTTISGSLSTVLEGGPRLGDEARRELLDSAHEEAERLNRLVSNLLEMTRIDSGALQPKKEWHALEEVVGAALQRLRRRLGQRVVTTRMPADLPLVPMDDVLIEQVLVNLLDNAIKYTPPDSPIAIMATATDQAITVEVADRGRGLPPGEETRIFERFYRARPTPSAEPGLGLAICKAIVEAHGGRIWAHNVPGGGVAFFFTLPLSRSPRSPAGA